MRSIRSLSPRDAVLVLIGATVMHIFSLTFTPFSDSSIVFNTHFTTHGASNAPAPVAALDVSVLRNPLVTDDPRPRPDSPQPDAVISVDLDYDIPETVLVNHAPGWSIFRNLYMSDGALLIVTSRPSQFPDIPLMISTSLVAYATPESIAERMPTSRQMDIISPAEARRRWAGEPLLGEKNRIYPIDGSTVSSRRSPKPASHVLTVLSTCSFCSTNLTSVRNSVLSRCFCRRINAA